MHIPSIALFADVSKPTEQETVYRTPLPRLSYTDEFRLFMMNALVTTAAAAAATFSFVVLAPNALGVYADSALLPAPIRDNNQEPAFRNSPSEVVNSRKLATCRTDDALDPTRVSGAFVVFLWYYCFDGERMRNIVRETNIPLLSFSIVQTG